MAATDTVVGIVGAVLLAGIMVAVFVYEYNNPPSPGGPPDPTLSDEERVAQWSKDYPGLAAKEDLDNDGRLNYNDTDMDENGVADVEQEGDLLRVFPVGETLAAGTQGYTKPWPVPVLSGARRIDASLYWNTTAPAPLDLPKLSCSLEKGGTSVARCTPTESPPSQRAHARTATVAENVEAGEHSFIVTQGPGAGPQTSYAGSVVVNYGPAHPPETSAPEPEPVK